MRHQLRQYAGRRISDFLHHGRGGEAELAQVSTWSIQAHVAQRQRFAHPIIS